jgi:hypothetical protein
MDLLEDIYPTPPAVHGGGRLAGGGQKNFENAVIWRYIFCCDLSVAFIGEYIFVKKYCIVKII